jgi:putative transcriptional regulator
MKRDDLVRETRQVLGRTGFFLTDSNTFTNEVFDLVGRRDATLVVVKCLLNGYSLTKEAAEQLLKVAHLLRGSPLVVSAHSTNGRLERGVVYLRYRAPLLSFDTLKDFLVEGVPPIAFAGPGGYFVQIDSVALRRARQARKLSLDALAREAGVSRRAIQLYEEGMSAAVEAAERIERFFGVSISVPLDPLTYHITPEDLEGGGQGASDFEAYVFKALEGMGYRVTQAARCPFDAMLEGASSRILGGVEVNAAHLSARAHSLAALARVAETDAVLFVSRGTNQSSIGGTPVVTRKELDAIGDSEEILEIIKQRKRDE